MPENSKNPLEGIEFLTAEELARRLFQGASEYEMKRKTNWVKEMSKPSRTRDPIPKAKFGKHNAYPWGSRAMNAWIVRRMPS